MPTPAPARPGASSKPPPARSSGQRRPFLPSTPPGPYRLPTATLERLTVALEPFRNREAAMALAVLLARFWSAPGRIARAFPVDRRALAGHAALAGMTEARVRGALATLEKIGFLDRPPIVGRTHQRTAEGLHRKPILWRFAPEFVVMFRAAHGARRAVQSANLAPRRHIGTPSRECPSTAAPAVPTRSPKHRIAIAGQAQRSPMIMGERPGSGPVARGDRERMPVGDAPCPALTAALERIRAARARSIAPRCKMEIVR